MVTKGKKDPEAAGRGKYSWYLQLRRDYPEFVYRASGVTLGTDSLHLHWEFEIPGLAVFRPGLKIPWHKAFPDIREAAGDPWFRFLAFQTGMIELVSYWKLTCSPRVVILPYLLPKEDLQWWKGVYFPGMGEFFHTNGIRADQDDFMDLVAESGQLPPSPTPARFREVFLIPVGGGKDSAVTLELLKRQVKVLPFLLNPRKAMTDTLAAAGFDPGFGIIFHRGLDPQLLRLNDRGFLNGHTPFSALLAFETLLASYLASSRYIALSNEASANEATIPGSGVNHQYSKTIAFEKDFRHYVNQHLGTGTEYFSYLRPLLEIQIAGLFSTFPAHFAGFRSCNAGSRANAWCGQCPKCLFACLMLAPYIDRERLCGIFGLDLLDRQNSWDDLAKLAGISEEKPFECVGTIDEVKAAIRMTAAQYPVDRLPYLLSRFLADTGPLPAGQDPMSILDHWNEDHCLPATLADNLQQTWKNYAASLKR